MISKNINFNVDRRFRNNVTSFAIAVTQIPSIQSEKTQTQIVRAVLEARPSHYRSTRQRLDTEANKNID